MIGDRPVELVLIPAGQALANGVIHVSLHRHEVRCVRIADPDESPLALHRGPPRAGAPPAPSPRADRVCQRPEPAAHSLGSQPPGHLSPVRIRIPEPSSDAADEGGLIRMALRDEEGGAVGRDSPATTPLVGSPPQATVPGGSRFATP